MSVNCPACTRPPLRERVEQKYFITPRRTGLALALLRRACRPDPDFPVGQVNSLYFDSLDLDQHKRSDSGEFSKDKIRIRWYGEDLDPHKTALDGAPGPAYDGTARVWLELKSRRGFASTKQRTTMDVAASALAFNALKNGIVPASVLEETMAGFGFFAFGPLRPVVTISYWRLRFVEPRSGFRISIDSRIRSSMVIPGVGIGERGLELPGMIVEVKGPRFEVPVSLHPLLEIGSSWTRYSKYSSSIDGHGEPRGTVSRLWPTGTLEEQPGTVAWVKQAQEDLEPATPVLAYETE
jgi:hypothetical protein